jgi:hypothetical protein
MNLWPRSLNFAVNTIHKMFCNMIFVNNFSTCSTMISQMKRKKKLNVKVLRQLLVPVLEHLDLDSVYLTQTILKTMWTNCPNLRVLSLKDCGYIVTDSVVETILRVKFCYVHISYISRFQSFV